MTEGRVGESQLFQIQSFDKRQLQHQMMAGNINPQTNHLIIKVAQDMKNKENMTQKPMQRKGTGLIAPIANPAE